MRAKPSTLEPSNHRPCSTASSNLWNGIWTFLTMPMMSVNCRLTNRTLAVSACSNTRCFIAALSVLGMNLVSSSGFLVGRAAAEGSPDLQRELQVEARFGVLEVAPAQQLLDTLESIDEGVAMHVQITCGAHVVAARAQERVEGADELGSACRVRGLQRAQTVALEGAQLRVIGEVEDQPQGAEPGEVQG